MGEKTSGARVLQMLRLHNASRRLYETPLSSCVGEGRSVFYKAKSARKLTETLWMEQRGNSRVLDSLHSKTLNGAEGKNPKTEELETSLEQIQERMGDYVAKSEYKWLFYCIHSCLCVRACSSEHVSHHTYILQRTSCRGQFSTSTSQEEFICLGSKCLYPLS